MSIFTFNVIKILSLAVFSSIISIIIAKFLIDFLHKIKFWKKSARSIAIDGKKADVFFSMHKEKETTVHMFLIIFLIFGG